MFLLTLSFINNVSFNLTGFLLEQDYIAYIIFLKKSPYQNLNDCPHILNMVLMFCSLKIFACIVT